VYSLWYSTMYRTVQYQAQYSTDSEEWVYTELHCTHCPLPAGPTACWRVHNRQSSIYAAGWQMPACRRVSLKMHLAHMCHACWQPWQCAASCTAKPRPTQAGSSSDVPVHMLTDPPGDGRGYKGSSSAHHRRLFTCPRYPYLMHMLRHSSSSSSRTKMTAVVLTTHSLCCRCCWQHSTLSPNKARARYSWLCMPC
jgi:hypothetical protein